jgi:RNA polymerase sigma-70 factor (ECF subfamily)
MKMCGDVSDAEDVVQETFIKIWTIRKNLRSTHSFYSFQLKIANNLLLDHYKHLKVRDKHKDNVPEIAHSYNDNPEQALDYKTRLEQIHYIANTYLKENYRSAFFLSRIEGKSNKEIAELLNISVKKVENYLYNALKKLSQKL